MFEALLPLGGIPALLGAATAVIFVGAAYFFATLDRARANSPVKDDTQLGIKLVLYGLILAGIQLASGGANSLLSYMLGGFKGGSMPVRVALPPIAVGIATVALIYKVFLPRTNDATAKQPERYALGALGIQYGVMALLGVTGILNTLFLEMPWQYTASSLSTAAVNGAVAFLAISRFGARAGWTAAVKAPRSGGGYPPQQGGGYPPQGGGYPPQGGGYPPR